MSDVEKLVKLLDDFNRNLSAVAGNEKYVIWDDHVELAKYLVDNDVIYGPGKASNAGGVSVSGLEMTQNALRLSWSKEEVDQKLKDIMINIFHNVYNTNIKYNIKSNDLLKGANIAGFVKIADAMIAQGVI